MDIYEREIKRVVNALQQGNYTVEIEEPNNYTVYERRDGTTFYVFHGDDCRFGVDMGSCAVHVLDYEFVNHFEGGDACAYGRPDDADDNFDADELLDSEDVKAALYERDDIFWGDYTFDQMDLYERIHPDAECYYVEDPDIPYRDCEEFEDEYYDEDDFEDDEDEESDNE